MLSRNPQSRFSDRVADYVRYRPSYPPALIDFLEKEANLKPGHRIADIGSGTGKLTELLLQRGWEVFAVEPNKEMRDAAERLLGAYSNFHSLNGKAELLPLPYDNFKLLTIAQAFHWVDPVKFRAEAREILASRGKAALIWNSRRRDLPLMKDYDELLVEMVPEYERDMEKSEDLEKIKAFFGHEKFHHRTFSYRQTLDWEGLKGRLMSASYCPLPSDPTHIPLMSKLKRLFDSYEEDGQVRFEYETVVYVGAVPFKV